jgi:ATP-binding protein involved in chromosome partitioning
MSATSPPTLDALAGVRDIVAVHSAKGGVGKSTVAANLAACAARLGMKVGLLDADVHGPSVAHMMGSSERPEPSRTAERVLPIVRHGVRYLSLANVATPDAPIIWRGPMVAGALQQLLSLVEWGELDLLLVDMPPGTGDAVLGIGQTVSLSGVVVVTTPQELSLADTRRGVQAFAALHVPALGLIENLSLFTCDACGDRVALFGEGAGRAVAESLGMPFLGRIPIDPQVATAGDAGAPIASAAPDPASTPPSERATNPNDTIVAFESALREIVAQLALRSGGIGAQHVEWSAHVERRLEPPDATEAVDGAEHDRPVAIWQADDDLLGIRWADGLTSFHGAYALRMACPCAACVEEWTRRKSATLDDVPRDVRPTNVRSVGRYALQPTWSDGHRTGIFSFAELRRGAGRVDPNTRNPIQE